MALDGYYDTIVTTLNLFLPVITLVSQYKTPAPWGRYDPKDGKWGPGVNQRVAHMLNDGLWGVVFFFLIVFLKGLENVGKVNIILMSAWITHFIHRGFIHPFYMRYSSKDVALGIPLTGFTLAYFSYLHAVHLTTSVYDDSYVFDLRFLCGSFIFVVGFCINKWADFTLRNLRSKSGEAKYTLPNAGLFRLVSCPNYLGEMIEWFGWAIATWSTIGFVYFSFASATFIPRSKHNHQWYFKNFKNYPRERKAIIPLVY